MWKGSLRGRRLKGKRKGVLGKGVLGAREMRGACEEGGRETPRAWSRALIPFPFPFKRLPRRLVKGVLFINIRYTKGLPFLSKMIYKTVRDRTWGQPSLGFNLCWIPPGCTTVWVQYFLPSLIKSTFFFFFVKTYMAHCCHGSDEELNLLSERCSAVAHCPTSNFKWVHASLIEAFLKIGLLSAYN